MADEDFVSCGLNLSVSRTLALYFQLLSYFFNRLIITFKSIPPSSLHFIF